MKVMNKSIVNLEDVDIKDFLILESSQLNNDIAIFCSRIVYHDFLSQKRQETIAYAENQSPLDRSSIDYLRSEQWLLEYPPVFSVTALNLDRLSPFAYICPLGYRNQSPEYIQVFTREPLSERLQQQLKKSAMSIGKYLNLYLDWNLRKQEIKLLERILQTAGHQLRNSLSLIALYAQNLCFSLKDRPERSQAEVIGQSIQTLDLNLNELIDCSQSGCLRLMPQDLRSIFRESIDLLQPAIERKQLNILLPEISTVLTVDRLQIKQVFDNLLSNAIYFSPMFGTISCSWQIFQGEVLIKIADEGTGISSEDLPKVFNPFYSRRQGGNGLGLTIAKKIVLDHQGSIWAQNLATGGAQFSLILSR